MIKGKNAMQGPEEDTGLAGKVALVSGGGAAGDGIGNGRAAAILLARAGVRVLVADRELALAQRTVEMIEAEGGTATLSIRPSDTNFSRISAFCLPRCRPLANSAVTTSRTTFRLGSARRISAA